MKPAPVHLDKLGREITEGACVAVAHHNSLAVATVVKINPKTVKIKIANITTNSWYSGVHNKYGDQMVVIDGPLVTMYLLKLK
jgi:hypothetical protein